LLMRPRPPVNLSEVVAGSVKAESTANASRSHTTIERADQQLV
jgi:hypothetical protein